MVAIGIQNSARTRVVSRSTNQKTSPSRPCQQTVTPNSHPAHPPSWRPFPRPGPRVRESPSQGRVTPVRGRNSDRMNLSLLFRPEATFHGQHGDRQKLPETAKNFKKTGRAVSVRFRQTPARVRPYRPCRPAGEVRPGPGCGRGRELMSLTGAKARFRGKAG
jgi:hypothetical protein